MSAMDFSGRRDGPGYSVFWMILGLGFGVAVLLAVALTLTEAGPNPTTGSEDNTTTAVGPAPTGAADVTDSGMADPAFATDLIENGSGAALGQTLTTDADDATPMQ